MYMEQAQNSPSGSRRNEDIALDLLKFVSSVAGIGRTGSTSTGFTASTSSKPEDHVAQLLDLYARCLRTVEGKG
jgi:hypothetical protein